MSDDQSPRRSATVTRISARRSVPLEAVLDLFGRPLFDRAGILEIVLSIGRRKAPASHGYTLDQAEGELWEICKSFAFDRYIETQATTSEKDAQALRLVDACGMVLAAGGFDPNAEPTPDALLPMLGIGGLFGSAAIRGEAQAREATLAMFHAVWQLRQDARAMRGVMEKRLHKNPPRKGRTPELAIKKLAAHLSEFHFHLYGARPTVALDDDGGATSSFLRLFVKIQRALHERGVDTHIREPDALRQIWQRLDDFDALRFKITGEPVGAPEAAVDRIG